MYAPVAALFQVNDKQTYVILKFSIEDKTL